VAGTLYGKNDSPRIVGLDDHFVDLPPSSHMLIVRNSDVPGMIGTVGSILGAAGVNIADMGVGRSPSGEAALMAISTSDAVAADVVAKIRAEAGILDAKAIELG
jgi:D-3-phosphoglycerate dehydrogenase